MNTKTAADIAAERHRHSPYVELEELKAAIEEIKKELCHLSGLMSHVTTAEAAMPAASTQTEAASVSPATPSHQATAKRRSRNAKGNM